MAPSDLQMLSRSTCVTVDGGDDAQDFGLVVAAMRSLAISEESLAQLWELLCGLLVLGNVTFVADDAEKANVSNSHLLASAETLLGCSNLVVNLTSKESGRKSLGGIQLTVPQAEAARDAAIKDIYVHLFDWVVGVINSSICGHDGATSLPYIGLLDIFGFESFKFNSFEQLCINFTNEKLHQFFILQVFHAEEEAHVKEGVPLTKVDIHSNQKCINMLELKPDGIFLLLDTQCKMPNGSEGGFVKAVNEAHAKSPFLARPRQAKLREDEGFIVKHFAGDVTYHTSSLVTKTSKQLEVPWLEKNKDQMDKGWLQKLAYSKVALLSGLFVDEFEASKAKKPASTVGRRFCLNVTELLAELGSIHPFFIRCIKPNTEKVPKVFTVSLVLDELRCSGLMSAVSLMQQAYPTRVPYDSIFSQVRAMIGDETVDQIDCIPSVFCEKVMQVLGKSGSYALGKSKLFLKAGGGGFLQDLKQMDPDELVTGINEKLKAARWMLVRTFSIVRCYIRWRHKTFAKLIAAMLPATQLIQQRFRTKLYQRRYEAWRAARLARIEEEKRRVEAEERAALEVEEAEALRLRQIAEAQVPDFDRTHMYALHSRPMLTTHTCACLIGPPTDQGGPAGRQGGVRRQH